MVIKEQIYLFIHSFDTINSRLCNATGEQSEIELVSRTPQSRWRHIGSISISLLHIDSLFRGIFLRNHCCCRIFKKNLFRLRVESHRSHTRQFHIRIFRFVRRCRSRICRWNLFINLYLKLTMSTAFTANENNMEAARSAGTQVAPAFIRMEQQRKKNMRLCENTDR